MDKPTLPENKDTRCRICGEVIYKDDEYEVVRRRSASTLYFHTSCVEKEKERNKEARR